LPLDRREQSNDHAETMPMTAIEHLEIATALDYGALVHGFEREVGHWVPALNFVRDFGERFASGCKAPSGVDFLMNAPFEA
jgi:hypothetical protein